MRYSNQTGQGSKVLPDADSPQLIRAKDCGTTLKGDAKQKKGSSKNKKAYSCVQQPTHTLIVNTYNTVYDVVTLAAQDLNFKERKVDPGLCSNPYLFLEGNNQGGATFNF